ncbi:hypothetical protein HZH66_014345 [Vespula vulgaris]|uniref:Uncharacterized protein n=1 Tax=Vespula vulgaris TaxID=7454 RepID=A0A834J5T8_VESVU|nr:hypothetical protein HZH66_014345 [Vespula vulgaris]
MERIVYEIFRDVAGGDGGGGGGGGGWHGESRKSGLFQHAREKRRFMIATLALTWSGEQLRDGCGCAGGSGERAERDDRGVPTTPEVDSADVIA